MRRVALLGSTGSIGTQTLDVIQSLNKVNKRFEVVALAVGRNVQLLNTQIENYSPKFVCIQNEQDIPKLKKSSAKTFAGAVGLQDLLKACGSDLVVNALVGAAGLMPTLTAINLGIDVALANKESLVIGGHLVIEALNKSGTKLIPIDSEHSAIFQLLHNQNPKDISRIILTASGGALRDLQIEDLSKVTPEQVLKHPTWQMGRRITVDSATLVNKAFEVIEAKWLFDLAWDQIDVVLHPQSIVHGLVEFSDGSLWAHLGAPDMRVPIQYALTYPERQPGRFERLDFKNLNLNFRELDRKRYPAFDLVLKAGRISGSAPAAVNAADEVAVEKFLAGQISFTEIWKILEEVLEKHKVVEKPNLEKILEADRWGRKLASTLTLGD